MQSDYKYLLVKKVIDKQKSSIHHFKEQLSKFSFHTYAGPTCAPLVALHTSREYSTCNKNLMELYTLTCCSCAESPIKSNVVIQQDSAPPQSTVR